MRPWNSGSVRRSLTEKQFQEQLSTSLNFIKRERKQKLLAIFVYEGEKEKGLCPFSRKQKLQAIFVYEGEKEKGQSPFSPMVKAERKAELKEQNSVFSLFTQVKRELKNCKAIFLYDSVLSLSQYLNILLLPGLNVF